MLEITVVQGQIKVAWGPWLELMVGVPGLDEDTLSRD